MQKKWAKRDFRADAVVLKLRRATEARRLWSAESRQMNTESPEMRESQHGQPGNLSMLQMNNFPTYDLFIFPKLYTVQ